MAKHKYIETPEKMWELFCSYREEIKKKPIHIVEQRKGNIILPKGLSSKEIKEYANPIVQMPLQRPLTLEGFENWCADNEIIEDLSRYFANTDNKYSEFCAICSRIRRVIRQDQIEGGMAGIYNPSITQRLNNLKEQSDITTNGKSISSISIEIVPPNESKS